MKQLAFDFIKNDMWMYICECNGPADLFEMSMSTFTQLKQKYNFRCHIMAAGCPHIFKGRKVVEYGLEYKVTMPEDD
jgi:hypothetical protein